MLKLINLIIIKITLLLPKKFISIFAKKYVAGFTDNEALSIIQKLNNKGYSATIDILGEHTKNIRISRAIASKYSDLFRKIKNRNLDCNISIKPTHIGLDISENEYLENLKKLVDSARENNNFLRIDMENSKTTDITINSYKRMLKTYNSVGTVFQAYLYRTFEDINKIQNPEINFRLCKGIYKESKTISIQDKDLIRENYLKIVKHAFLNKNYIAIATHDTYLLKEIYFLIKSLKIDPVKFEFQTLYGVPINNWLKKHLNNGYKVRIYVPYGPDWYDYSIRRLKENPNIAIYIIKNLFLFNRSN